VSRTAAQFCVLALLATAAACDQVALLAPTGSTVTITVSSTSVGSNGSAEVVATVIESAGTPVHNGTEVNFQASVGILDPAVVRTEGGVARTTFRANGASGTAKVSAFSGGAKSPEVELRVGSAAAETIAVRTTPSTVPPTGGSVQVVATVRDISGNALTGAQVVFSTDNGILSTGSGVTDQQGEAVSTLTTSRETNVRASVAAKEGTARVTVVSLPSAGVTVSPANPVAGVPVSITVTPGSTTTGNPIQNVLVDFGDSTPEASLGAITSAQSISHVYGRASTYTVTVTVVDTAGQRNTTSTAITVQGANLSVTVTGPPIADAGTAVSFTVSVTNPNNAPITGVTLDFGNGLSTQLGSAGGTAQTTYALPGNFTVRATARDAIGNSYSGTHVITIRPRVAIAVTLDAIVNENTNAFSCSTTYPKTCQTTLSAFVPPPGAVPGARVLFTAAAGFATAASYTWDFNGDGVADRTTSSASTDFLFTAPGTFTVRVRVTTTDGNAGEQYLTLIISP
jgi:Bacterial Ig-like domain (group 1)/PKD domain